VRGASPSCHERGVSLGRTIERTGRVAAALSAPPAGASEANVMDQAGSLGEASPERRSSRIALRVTFGIVGAGAAALLVRGVGPSQLVAILRESARWVPLLLAIEAVRILCEVAATAVLSRRVRERVRLGELLRIHLTGYAAAVFLPAGRAMCEAIKAAALAKRVGGAHAAAIGATNQSLALLGGAIIGSIGVVTAYLTAGFSPVTGAIALYVLTAAAGFAVVQIACRRRSIGGFFGQRFARMRAASASFHEALGEIPVVPRAALAIVVLERALQALEIGVAIRAVGGAFGLRISFLAQGISLVGGSLGDLIPGQLGAVDGAFALAAPMLGIASVAGVAVAVLVRCAQLAWMAVGIAASFGGRPRGAIPAVAGTAS
jgi:hypothetical protein